MKNKTELNSHGTGLGRKIAYTAVIVSTVLGVLCGTACGKDERQEIDKTKEIEWKRRDISSKVCGFLYTNTKRSDDKELARREFLQKCKDDSHYAEVLQEERENSPF